MVKIFTHNIKVGKKAIDENNHVNNVVYVKWMQDVAILHSTEQGWSQKEYFEIKAGWVVKSHFVQYKSPAFMNDEIIVHTWVSTMSSMSSLRKYKFIRKADSKILAEAETDWVFVNIKTGRPTKILGPVKKSFQIVHINQEP
ncbi:MAG: acyl-CoA thioesterase [Desulfobacterales bacterium]|nr:acyl-CoA thioesterase [Desulfobacterales bacterium]